MEIILKGLPEKQREYYRWMATFKLRQTKESAEVYSLRDKLRRTSRWLRHNRITLVRADKDKRLVLMKRDTYERHLNEYIRETQCTEVQEDYIDKLQSRVKRLANSKLASKLNLKNIIVDAPDAPKLFAFAKTHKQEQKLRPVVDKARAPTQILEKATHNLLTAHLEDYEFTISNSIELIQQLKTLSSPVYATVLDFRSLYPSIELPPCFCALRDFLFSKVNDTSLHREVLELAHLICYSSVFQFNGIIYMQNKGVPMGSPVSGDLCEMVVRRLENITLPTFLPDILLYKRYIDDVIILWKTEPNIDQFIKAMNKNPYGLVIEVEQHSNSKIHFLDIDIALEGPNIHTSVYRKTDTASMYIPMGSCDPFQYKIAAFRALVRRAFTHSSSHQALNQEIKRINEIAVEHGYTNLIRGLCRKYRKCQKQCNNQTERHLNIQENNTERIPITFNPRLKSIYATISKKRQVRIAYRRCQTIFQILRNGKDPPNPIRLPGIYTIPLRDHRFDRDMVYIGSTKRTMGIRIKEHKADIAHKRLTTALSTYATDQEVTADFTAARIILTTNHPEHLKLLEAMEIYRAGCNTTCINFKDELALSAAWQLLLEDNF
ncbi:uncharacterized protein [Centruroides vittatus]|uniref:uncharacterized protein n=1 Tax=Centruroides vittatus TaxID=120091 RepID=UPI00351031E3